MNKWLSTAFLVAPLVAAGYLFGMACERIGGAYQLILSPSTELLILLLWFLAAVGAIAVTAGLVAALLRPIWVAVVAFALSTLAICLGWQLTVGSGVLALAYLAAGAAYVAHVSSELSQRITFSARPVADGQGTLRLALILVACGTLYLSCAPQIRREAFSIPETYLDTLAGQMEKQIAAALPEGQRREAVQKFREEFRRMTDGLFERTIGRYERFMPLLLAASVFMTLVSIANLLAWVPSLALHIAFSLLAVLGITKVVTETREVERLVLA